MAGLRARLAAMDGEKMGALMMLGMSLGTLLGKGKRAMRILLLLDEYPGRVEALKSGQERLDKLAADIEELVEEGDDVASENAILDQGYNLPLTGHEVLAMDEWKDLQSKSAGWLKRKLRGSK